MLSFYVFRACKVDVSRLAPTPATFLARNSGLALLVLGTLLVALPAKKTLLPCSVLATVSLQFKSLPSDVAGLALLMTMGPHPSLPAFR